MTLTTDQVHIQRHKYVNTNIIKKIKSLVLLPWSLAYMDGLLWVT